jgi:tetraacyldisaccharide 4'-kinase
MKTSLTQRILSRDNSLPLMLLRILLSPFQLAYMGVVTTRNALYDTGLLEAGKVDVPVLSVGNLTMGGTGKTPLVIALARRALDAGKKVAVVTRGYGAVADDAGRSDEAAMIAERLPEAMLVISPDKLTGARQAAADGADLVIVDDGFQHRRLARDLDIVVMDARAPFGNGCQIPLGGLREAASSLHRADLVVLTHTEGLEPARLHDALARIGAHHRGVPVVQGIHKPVGVRSVTSDELQPLSDLAGQEVFLFCGIGSPEGFAATAESLGALVTGVAPFPDHHAFTGTDLAAVRAEARTARLMCTEKDAGKVGRLKGNHDVLCLAIDMEIVGELPALPGIDA